MAAVDTVAGRIGASVATLTAVTPGAGDSLTVRSHPFEAGAHLHQATVRQTAAGTLRIRSPRLHDFVQGIRVRYPAGGDAGVFPRAFAQRLFSQDPLTVEMAGTGAGEAGVVALEHYYANLPGVEARLATWEEIAPRIEHYLGQEAAITTNAVAGQWGPGDALDADFDTFKVNRDYAFLGAQTDVPIGFVTLRGSETGNLRIGCPVGGNLVESRDYNVRQGAAHGIPRIPVFNSANREGTLVDALDDAAATAVNVTFVLALLAE